MKHNRAATLMLIITAVVAQICEPGLSYCADVNGCYDPSQYTCSRDKYNGQNRLCGAGTSSCNDVCVADCAYTCLADGTYTVRADRTCAPPPSCASGTIACGDACYNSSQFCCISGRPQDVSRCPSDTSNACTKSQTCPFTIDNVGSLYDGQLRLNFGPGAFPVNFTLVDGKLIDNRGQICYISASGQLQCNYAAQTDDTSFYLSGDYLGHARGLLWYECDVGTGGSNLYDRSIDATCSALYLDIIEGNCKAVPSTRTRQPSTSDQKSTTSNMPPTTSYSECRPDWKGIGLPLPFLYFSFDLDISMGLVRDESGNGNHGQVTGTPHKTRGKIQLALEFNTAIGFQNVKVEKASYLGIDFSIATWIKINKEAKSVAQIASTRSGLWSRSTGWDLSLCPKTSTVTFTSGYSSVSWKVNVTSDTWAHLAFTASANRVTLYINGVAGLSQTIRISKCTELLHIASSRNGCVLSGSIDDFVVFDLAITLEQVRLIRDKRCSGSTSQPSTRQISSTFLPSSTRATATTTKKENCGLPWLYWSFDNTNTTRCTDDSGHGRHGGFSGLPNLLDGKLRKSCKWNDDSRRPISFDGFSLVSTFSIAVWIKLDATRGQFVVATTKTKSGDQAGWELSCDGRSQFKFESAGASAATWDANIKTDVWFHLAVTVKNGAVELFVNGDTFGVKTVAPCQKTQGSLKVAVQLRGALDEFLVFDNALEKEQVCDARDKYLTGKDVRVNGWSRLLTSFEWGVDWEKSNLDDNKRDRLTSWWKWQSL